MRNNLFYRQINELKLPWHNKNKLYLLNKYNHLYGFCKLSRKAFSWRCKFLTRMIKIWMFVCSLNPSDLFFPLSVKVSKAAVRWVAGRKTNDASNIFIARHKKTRVRQARVWLDDLKFDAIKMLWRLKKKFPETNKAANSLNLNS